MKSFLRTVFCSAAVFCATSGMLAQQDSTASPFTNGKEKLFEMHPSGVVNFAVGNIRQSTLTLNNNSILRNAFGAHIQVRDNRSQDILEVSFEKSPKFDMTYASVTLGAGAFGVRSPIRAMTTFNDKVRFSLSPRAGLFVLQKPDQNQADENVTNFGAIVQLDADLTVYPFKKAPNFGVNGNIAVTGFAGAGGDGQNTAVFQTRSAVGLTWKIG